MKNRPNHVPNAIPAPYGVVGEVEFVGGELFRDGDGALLGGFDFGVGRGEGREKEVVHDEITYWLTQLVVFVAALACLNVRVGDG